MNNNLVQRILYILVWSIILIGLSGTIPLVSKEYLNGNVCPKIIGIPACYIILSCLVLAIISHSKIIRDKNRLYFIGVVLALSIATFGSVGNILEYVECPKTEGGIPMCYLSFLIFFGLFLSKIIIIKIKPVANKD
jgi:hypothetical protein